MLGIKANGHYIRQVAVTCRRGTNVIRILKFLTPFFNSQQSSLLTIITVPTRVVVTGELPCVTNSNRILKFIITLCLLILTCMSPVFKLIILSLYSTSSSKIGINGYRFSFSLYSIFNSFTI